MEAMVDWRNHSGGAAAAALAEGVTYRRSSVPLLRTWMGTQLEH